MNFLVTVILGRHKYHKTKFPLKTNSTRNRKRALCIRIVDFRASRGLKNFLGLRPWPHWGRPPNPSCCLAPLGGNSRHISNFDSAEFICTLYSVFTKSPSSRR